MRLKRPTCVAIGVIFGLTSLVIFIDYEISRINGCSSDGFSQYYRLTPQKSPSTIHPTMFIKSKEQMLKDDNIPLVLIYTDKYYAKMNDLVMNFLQNLHCKWNCRYTIDKRKWNESRTVLIREQFPTGEYPPHSNPDQRVILTLPEAPGRIGVRRGLAKIPKNYVNLTFGYMKEFDFYKPYDAMVKQQTSEADWQGIKQKLESKKKGAFIVYSNCESDSKREDYIEELKKHYSVDTFGKCGDGKCDAECMKRNLQEYHFYIAFENNVCEDYFSEKFFRIKDLILPLVLKDSVYRGRVPNNSYIAVDQFETVQHLASHLQYLQDNHTAYLEYFQWTKFYSFKKPSLWGEQYCRVCENAYDRDFRKIYEDISEWFGPEKRCDNGLVSRLLKGNEN